MRQAMIFFSLCHFCLAVLAQTPEGITHQAIIRNTAGELLTDQVVVIQVSILQDSADGTVMYSETHLPTSNAHGLITYVIGQGTVVDGVFANIDWSDGPYFLKMEIDPEGGTNYSIMGTTQFQNVPFAYHSKTANIAKSIEGSVSSNIQAPKVTISTATDIQHHSATLNGIVNGEGFLTNVVFEWGETSSYGNTIEAAQSPVKGSSDVNVSAHLSGLQTGTTYNYRIRASNAVDFVYSENASLRTEMSIPQITTDEITSITTYSAISGGHVIYDGGSTVTAKGVIWSTEENPTVDGNDGITDDGTGSGLFISKMDGLSMNTTYFMRAYATNAIGTNYGEQQSFTTLLGQKPDVLGNFAIEITTSIALLYGFVNANNLETTVIFEYGLTTDYGSTITATQSPISGNSKTDVTASIDGLSVSTTYYLRIIAENELGITCGANRSFTTQGSVPYVKNVKASAINTTSADLYAVVLPGYLETTVVIEYGLTTDYGYTITPTQSPLSADLESQVVNVALRDLIPGTTYYYRVKAENVLGVTYENRVLNTKDTFTDTRDGQIYKTIKIGEQIWMAENLRHLPSVVGPETGSATIPYYYVAYFWGTDVETAKTTSPYQDWGVLYNWPAAMDGFSSSIENPSGVQGICPSGWHLPSDTEWTQLTNYVGYYVDTKLRSDSGWLGGDNGTDEFGFSALPGGYRSNWSDNGDISFSSCGYLGRWWTSTEHSSQEARVRFFSSGSREKDYGISIRCVSDN